MTQTPPVLHMLCGKIAAGKSTMAARLAEPDGTVLISEDGWLSALFGDEMATPKDFMRVSAKMRAAMGPHIVALLNAGVSVVLDFQANTPESRQWMRGLLDQTKEAHALHVLMPPEAVCLERLRARNASGQHPFTVSEAQFHQVSKYFSPPDPAEGFTLVLHEDG